MLLVPRKRLLFGPPFLFQVSDDVKLRGCGCLVAPKFPHLFDTCKVMTQFAVAHPVGRLARKLIQPAMHLFKWLTQHGCRFRAVVCERGHKFSERSQSQPTGRLVLQRWLVQPFVCAERAARTMRTRQACEAGVAGAAMFARVLGFLAALIQGV
jgi:hypothetical protein